MRTMTALALACALLSGAAVSASSAAEIKPGMITISLGSDVHTMDPHASSSAITNTIHRYVFDTLTHRPKGAVTAVPWAAESIRLVDPSTYEFKMREGVKFTNGEDVDAAAVKFSLLRPRTPGYRSAQSKVFRNIKDIEIVSKWVVRVKLTGPDPGLLNRLSDYGNLVPPKYYASISQEDAAVKPIGSGPYKLVRWTKDVEMVFEANPDYWDKKLSLIKTVRVVPIREEGTKVAALLSGEVNLVANIPPQYIPRLKKDPRTKVEIEMGTRIYHLGFTHGIKSPLSDVRVRRAIAYAINRNVLVKDVVEGYGVVANSPLHQWTEGHDPKLGWPYPYDPAKAKALLKEAGYPNGFDIDFYSPAGRYTKDKEVAEAIAGFLQAVGVRAHYQPLTWGRFVEVFRAKSKPGTKPFLYYIGYGNGNGDTDRTLNAIASCKGVWSGYCNPALDKLMDKALGTSDLKARAAIFKEIVNKMVADVSHVFLWQEDALYGMTRDIHWDVRNDDRVYAWEISRK
jgi:peptide/nickel transport system substrate-binding protein